MTAPSQVSNALIWPTTFAGVLAAAILTIAVLAGPADAQSPAAINSTVALQR